MGITCLIDTHILLWWFFDDPQLNQACREIIRDRNNLILVSSASAWEIATKYRLGKLPEAQLLVAAYQDILNQANFTELPISTAHALRAGNLPIEHRDPFDRMLMAQAEIENIPIMTYDSAFKTGLIKVLS
ncbi:MAG: twitching motility protein PilT [Alkalinema sp. CACIAM 70d]|nr:MAG: twitching motility protein PilT [Alkalinema sp. CACIAM 70d]